MTEASPYDVIIHPFVTEKTMAAMERENKIEFLVKRTASKPAIRKAVEKLFDADVKSVNVKIGRDGQKHAIVKFGEGTKAEEVATRIGIF